MKSRIFWLIPAALTAVALAGCATSATYDPGGPSISASRSAKYDGPKARVAVAKFINKSARGGYQLGSGMSDMLVTQLFKTNRFIVLDRQDLDAVINEQDFGAGGRVSDETAAAIGELEGADLLVIGAVTEFEQDHIGAGGLVVGALSLGASIFFAVNNDDAPIGAVMYKESYVAVDVKIVDARTGRIVYAGTAKGRFQDWGGGAIGGVGGGSSRVPVMVGGFAGTGAEQAIRACVKAATADIVKNTPQDYYRVQEDEAPILASQLAPFWPISLTNAAAKGPDQRAVFMISTEKGYTKLLEDLGAPQAAVSGIDWEKYRVIAVFAGQKPNRGHRVGVVKAIHLKDTLRVDIRETMVPLRPEKDEVVPVSEPYWPFDLVRIKDPGKPLRYEWLTE